MATTIRNLSGKFETTANGGYWPNTTYDVAQKTLSYLTPAQFLAEQPTAIIPKGHIAANNILKISLNTSDYDTLSLIHI